MLQSGDMTPMEALRIATIYGAESIGYGADLGSIEPGKLADLQVLDANPLENIPQLDLDQVRDEERRAVRGGDARSRLAVGAQVSEAVLGAGAEDLDVLRRRERQ